MLESQFWTIAVMQFHSVLAWNAEILTGEPKRTPMNPPEHWLGLVEEYDAARLPALPPIDRAELCSIAHDRLRRQYLAQVGDVVLRYASMKALTRAGLKGPLHNHLVPLNTNNLFAHLALTYGLSELLPFPGYRSPGVSMKTSADVFEAYIGALWLGKVAADRPKQGEAAVLKWLATFFGEHIWPRVEEWNHETRREAGRLGDSVQGSHTDEEEWINGFGGLGTADEPLYLENNSRALPSPVLEQVHGRGSGTPEAPFEIMEEGGPQFAEPPRIELLSTVSRRPRLPRAIANAPSPEPESASQSTETVNPSRHCEICQGTRPDSNIPSQHPLDGAALTQLSEFEDHQCHSLSATQPLLPTPASSHSSFVGDASDKSATGQSRSAAFRQKRAMKRYAFAAAEARRRSWSGQSALRMQMIYGEPDHVNIQEAYE